MNRKTPTLEKESPEKQSPEEQPPEKPRSSRELVAASSRPMVLSILTGGESYGYEILKQVRLLSGGRLEWSDGMLYPVLHRLERDGLIAGRWALTENERRRKYYRLTNKGKGQLARDRESWRSVHATLEGLWADSMQPGEAP